ncbi:MAG: CRISPR-associated endonuclease Cas2 [Microcystis aeruginosa Ma_QC_Ch_20071001_S25]|jgi:CRISPR-associated protein Cas2|uniref:CRISPR-associated endoribonuclease Cas2 n=3 Tax=Microcystis aeruginosa TaxID=1126 RepID=A0A552D9X9_MICAE|nr:MULTISPECIES: CRISPR-associated endonuclease Cas2 [unclassified Microcystis]MCA2764620.1 CRISPR-associated endonuclease Cas2 [Microcystis sp. M151S2]NCR21304.1 CRISPR-associated endonuclease Cas2 [Microcystis aeruginosa L111-01]NCS05932.1 CRISPR-associated endonuclease Cas2 [Microcystis aeruginosa G13-07]NCS38010.1 CRISPR-associated endonuclease Cas2 [Microcystis aeruginosa BS13-10]NCS48755.1 CRISPR-associated endonuclease Cas2 [Microcystis aeruginosa BK11-02]NCS51103.1 CRISPR-associated e
MFYLICYDIVDDRRRTRVARLLEAYGVRIQKSVFESVLNPAQYEKLQARLLQLLERREDQLRFYPLSEHCRNKVIVLGIQPDFQIDDPALII